MICLKNYKVFRGNIPSTESEYLGEIKEYYKTTDEYKIVGEDQNRKKFTFAHLGIIGVNKDEKGLAILTLMDTDDEINLLKTARLNEKFKLVEVPA